MAGEKSVENLATLLGTTLLVKRLGAIGVLPAVAVAAWDGYTGEYNRRLMRVLDVPEADMRDNPYYARLRQEGLNDLDARFEVVSGEANQEGAIGMLVSAVSAVASFYLKEVTRTGTEGPFLKFTQDRINDYIFNKDNLQKDNE